MADKKQTLEELQQEFGYLRFREQEDGDFKRIESGKERTFRKIKENPLIPIGLSVTTFALVYGLWQMKTGNRQLSQKMMRLRVAAQGFTVLALLGGIVVQGMNKKT